MSLHPRPEDAPRLLIAGCGDLGIRLARRLPDWEVHGLRRRAEQLPESMVRHAADLNEPGALESLRGDWDAVVYTATPSGRSPEAYRSAYVEGLKRLLDQVRARRLVFVSSTAVYAQDHGEWIDEHSAAESNTFNGKILLEAERLTVAAGGIRLRLSGIYGPGRNWLIRSLRAGPVSCRRTPPVWTNRIYAEDCAGVLAHLLRLEAPENLYLGSDLRPAPRWEVLEWLAARLGVPGPVEQADGTQGQGKRIRAQRLLDSGYCFQYPDYTLGYTEMLACA